MALRRRIGVFIELDSHEKHHQAILGGIWNFAKEQDWEVVICPQPPGDFHLRRGTKGFDGVVGRITPKVARLVRKEKIPTVNVWRSSPVTDLPTVGHHEREIARLAVEHLLERGFNRIVHVGFENVRGCRLLALGVQEAIGSKDISFSQRLFPWVAQMSGPLWYSFQAKSRRWISGFETPAAIITSTDYLARFMAYSVLQGELSIPSDVAIIGIQNALEYCLYQDPTLSSVELGSARVGQEAAMLLDNMMLGGSPPDEPILVSPVEVVARASTDTYAISDPVISEAMRFITENLNKPIMIPDVVAQVPLSERSLERRYKKVRGITISQDITRLRLARVKRMLAETDLPIKTIALRCGFSSQPSFCRLFQRVEGISASEYRQRRARMATR